MLEVMCAVEDPSLALEREARLLVPDDSLPTKPISPAGGIILLGRAGIRPVNRAVDFKLLAKAHRLEINHALVGSVWIAPGPLRWMVEEVQDLTSRYGLHVAVEKAFV